MLEMAILEELLRYPSPYLMGQDALRNSVRWAVSPQPTYAEISQALARLEQSGAIVCIRHALLGDRWSITDKGKALASSI